MTSLLIGPILFFVNGITNTQIELCDQFQSISIIGYVILKKVLLILARKVDR